MKNCINRIVLTLALAGVMIPVCRAQDTVGVALEYDSTAVFTVDAGEEIHFELVARDENQNVFDQWDQTGRDVVLIVDSSFAETDTSTVSWNADPDGYSWLRLWLNDSALSVDSVEIDPRHARVFYTIPHSRFVDGRAALRFAQSREARGITISVIDNGPALNRQSPRITVRHAPVDNLLLTLTTPTQGPNKVFFLRLYEIVVWPRDRYLNIVSDTTVRVVFTARFPSEFDTNNGPSDIFSAPIYLTGVTNYYVSSRIRRMDIENEERQWVLAYSPDDTTVAGRTDPYEILDHAPNSFALLLPADSTELNLHVSTNVERFTWTMALPPDPYTDIQISMFDPSTFSDAVMYKIRFLDAASLTRAIVLDADNQGRDTIFTANHGQLTGVINYCSGWPTTRELQVVWYVEASDGLYVTESTPPNADSRGRAGFLLTLKKDFDDAVTPLAANSSFTLHPNYPNPFNPGTAIPIELQVSGYCRLQVLDLMGKEIAVLHEGFLEAGAHRFTFDGRSLPSGVYSYRLEADGVTRTRSMLLLR